jgi:hypothetical protein
MQIEMASQNPHANHTIQKSISITSHLRSRNLMAQPGQTFKHEMDRGEPV